MINLVNKNKFFILLTLLYIFIVIQNLRIVDIGYNISDSPSYFEYRIINPIRMPIITLLFSNLKYFGAIIIFQNLFSLISWILLAYSVCTFFENVYVKHLSSLLVYMISLSSQVLEHNFIILSESLTISALVLSLAAQILLLKKFTYFKLIIFCSAVIFFSGIKQSNSYFGIILLIITILILLNSQRLNLYKTLIFVFTIISLSFLIKIGSQNFEIKQNLIITTIIEQSYDDYSNQKKWEKYDFPPIAYQIYSSPPIMNPIDMLNNSPQIISWKRSTSKFIIEVESVKNTGYLFFGPLKPGLFIKSFTDYESVPNLISIGSTNTKSNNFLNATTDTLEPNFLTNLIHIKSIFWPSNFLKAKSNLIILLFIQVFSTLLLNLNLKKYTKLEKLLFINSSFTFFIIAIWLTWHITVIYEMKRYLVPWAIYFRIIIIISFCLVVDLILKKGNLLESKFNNTGQK